VDVSIIKVTKPHKNVVYLSMGVELTKDFINHYKLVIAEVSANHGHVDLSTLQEPC
jgi:hypothetical protein